MDNEARKAAAERALGGAPDMTAPVPTPADTTSDSPEATIAQAISMLESVAGQAGYEQISGIVDSLKQIVGGQGGTTPETNPTPDMAGAGQKI